MLCTKNSPSFSSGMFTLTSWKLSSVGIPTGRCILLPGDVKSPVDLTLFQKLLRFDLQEFISDKNINTP